jgi:cobalt-zinc-cadmium efflux system outer membrane protein
VLLAQKTIEVNEKLVQIGDKGVEVAEQLRAALEVSRADVLQAQIEAETAGLSLKMAQNRHFKAWRQLAAVLGQPEMDAPTLTGDLETDLPRIDWHDSLMRLLAESPELAQAYAGVERAKCQVVLRRAEVTPNYQVGAGVKYDAAAMDTLADLQVGIQLPLFDRNQGNIMEAQANLTAARRELERIELSLSQRLAEAFEQYVTARQHAEAYKGKIIPHATESLELTSTGYREGEFDYLTLLTAQRTFFNVSLEYLARLEALWTQSVEIEGLLLTGGLDAPE